MSERFELEITNGIDVSFQGKLIAEETDYEHNGSKNSRWHTIQLFETESGRYVVYESYATMWQNESCHHGVTEFMTLDEVAEHFVNDHRDMTKAFLASIGKSQFREIA